MKPVQTSPRSIGQASVPQRPRHRVHVALLAVALLAPQAACPMSLAQLLQLPLEQLMRLQVSGPTSSRHPPAIAPRTGSTSRNE